MASADRKKSEKYSDAQKQLLIDYMEQHPKLRSGKFDANFTHSHAKKLWENITRTLHAVPGSRKDWKQWRKVWHDIRNKVKAKSSEVHRHKSATGGGGPSTVVFTSADESVQRLLTITDVSGDPHCDESDTLFEFNAEVGPSHNEPMEKDVVVLSLDDTDVELEESAGDISKNPPKKATMGEKRLKQTTSITEKFMEHTKNRSKTQEEYSKQNIDLLQKQNEILKSMQEDRKKFYDDQLGIQKDTFDETKKYYAEKLKLQADFNKFLSQNLANSKIK